MKTKFLTFVVLVMLLGFASCNLTEDSIEQPLTPWKFNTNFNQKILDGYFVTSIAFDKQGNAWIGTFKQGLVKYNSKETIVYNSSNSIFPDASVIYDIAADSRDNIWIGCNGLFKYDGNTFTNYNSSNSPIPENNVMSVAIDSKDNVWFSSCIHRNGGIVKYDSESWIIFTPENSELPTNIVNDIAIDKSDNIWVTTHSKILSKISDDNLTTYPFDTLNGKYYSLGDISINNKNDVCIAINNGAFSGGIFACENCPKVLLLNGIESKELYNDNISLSIKSVFADSNDNIWCLDNIGYAVYDGINWTADDSTFRDIGVFTIEQAFDNRIWIGTGNGIYISD